MFYFLELPSLSNWLKSPGTSLITVIEAAIRLILYTINSLLYRGIRSLYNVFIALCNGQILDSDTLNGLFGRIGLLLGVIMMFRVAFSFIQVLINPDSFSDNQKGIPSIIKKVIIVIIMFGMSSYVFSFLRTLQSEIIESNVISKFLLPQQVETENFGGALEAELFTAFYNLDPALDYQTTNECASEDYINGLKNSIANNNSFSYKKQCVTELGTIKEDGSPAYFISFNFIFSTLVAVATLYFLLNYCISVGVRIVQLAALQIMSPMAIVGYLSPKSDNMFTKWVKVYFSTYIDAFLRMAIINFAVYIIAILIQGFNDKDSIFFTSVGYAAGEHKKLIYVIMIMAIFTFAKKAPDLLKKIFPATSESGISLGVDKDNKTALGVAAGVVGGAGIAAGAGIYNAASGIKNGKGLKGKAWGAVKGIGSGALSIPRSVVRGGYSGFSKGGLAGGFNAGREAQAKANLERMQKKGTPFAERAQNGLSSLLGVENRTKHDVLADQLEKAEKVEKIIEDNKLIKQLKEQKEIQKELLIKHGASSSAIMDKMNRWDNAIKDAKGQIYAAAQNKDNIGKELPNKVELNDPKINLNGKFSLEVDQTLRSAMEDNASRAGVKLDNFGWESYGDDKKALESNLATSHKIGGKNS